MENQVAHYYWPAMPAAGQLRLLPRDSSWRKSLEWGGALDAQKSKENRMLER
jgi:hypothetical protein